MEGLAVVGFVRVEKFIKTLKEKEIFETHYKKELYLSQL